MSYPGATDGQPILGRYTIIREIARSNDIVWEAMDPAMNRRLAVKELALTAGLTGQARRDRIERFHREARAAGNLNHPNIVTIYDSGEYQGRYYIAMEFLEGQTLRDKLSVGGPMSVSEAVAIVSALCDALDYAHLRGVVHRDIKPDNVHISSRGQVKLTDFGIARIQHENQLTVAGQVFGTPSYMSPEQIMGRPIDARSDIFSLGVMLYEMVSGRKPFTGDSVATITYGIVNEPTPPVPSGSPALDTVIQCATAKDPAGRFPSAAEMRAALQIAEEQHRTGSFHAPPAMTTPGPSPYQNSAPAYPPIPPSVYTPLTGVPIQNERRSGGRAGAIVATIAVVGLCFGLLAVGVNRALKTAGVEQAALAEQKSLTDAQAKFNAQQYGDAAKLATAIRSKTKDDQVKAAATKTEVYSYLALGNAARARDNFADAEKWYNMAQKLLPDDPSVKDHLAKFQQAKKYKGMSTATPAPRPTPDPAANGFPGSPTPPPGTQIIGTPAQVNTQQLGQSYQANAQSAQAYLDEGIQFERNGDIDRARSRWQLAIAAGPGSVAAQQAGDALRRTQPQ